MNNCFLHKLYKPVCSIILITILSIIEINNALSQKNTVFLEAFGVGGYGALNYGRTIYKLDKLPLTIAANIGIGTYKQRDILHQFNPDIFVPISLNAQYNYKKHTAEIGWVHTFASVLNMDLKKGPNQFRTLTHNGGLIVGYSFQFLSKPNLYFRIAYTPLIEQYQYFKHWGGLALGIKF